MKRSRYRTPFKVEGLVFIRGDFQFLLVGSGGGLGDYDLIW